LGLNLKTKKKWALNNLGGGGWTESTRKIDQEKKKQKEWRIRKEVGYVEEFERAKVHKVQEREDKNRGKGKENHRLLESVTARKKKLTQNTRT